ncbi:MAG: hypothetical protein AB2L11_08420 [Syntrophobacteraceae bacterium]
MAEIPHALIKDLLSTGYFYEELKNYTKSKDIDLSSFSRDFAVPYLTKQSESHQRAGQANRIGILNLAVKSISNADDSEIADTIFVLKKVAESEVQTNEKALHNADQLDKSEILCCRRKSETAQSLGKLLTSIIRMFKLAEVVAKRDASEGVCASFEDAIKKYWELSVLPGA